MRRVSVLCLIGLLIPAASASLYAKPVEVPRYSVHEVSFQGPHMTAKDTPARDVDLSTVWKHEQTGTQVTIHGFWDGDGRGGAAGGVYEVRFCPVEEGLWMLARTKSNKSDLEGQNEGYAIRCVASDHPGFWLPDPHTQNRWYMRSDGSHPYIYGDTLYSFLSEYGKDGPTGGNIRDDVVNTSRYFAKIRFGITGDRYVHPEVKPFLNDKGQPTDDGNYSHRPNPEWFRQRVDLAEQTAWDRDLIADIILCGPDTYESRSVLQAGRNNEDPAPLLKYMAARYGSYPNVWFCLCNEFDIKKPSYSTTEIVRFGTAMRGFLPYPTPMSIHARPRDWHKALNAGRWHDHVIIQKKLKQLTPAADWIARNYHIGGRVPVINDELAYEGKGDGWSEADVIEAHVGAFLGGGYGTTGHKPAGKEGHYFWGNFKAREHHSADNLKWLREQIDAHIPFWKMQPADPPKRNGGKTSIFSNVHDDFRAMEWPGHDYVLGTTEARKHIRAALPSGEWTVTMYAPLSKSREVLQQDASEGFTFDAAADRALLYHFQKH